MDAPVGRWRATYTPGEWMVLAGPTSVVVLQPASGERSALISTLWEEVLRSASLVEVAQRLAGYRIDAMPTFGAFFWTEDGMRSLVRGGVQVLDAATGNVVADGTGIQTWSEVGLDGVRAVRVELPDTGGASDSGRGGTPLTLPLVVGVVRASSVLLDASPQAQVVTVQDQSTASGADQPMPADDDERDTLEQEPDHADPALEGPATEFMTDPFPAQTAPEVPGEDYVETEALPDPPVDPQLDSMENGDTQLMAPVPPASPPSPGLSQDSMIMAVVCQYGHTSPQNATVCRICGSPIVPQGPQLVPRPSLAVLRASNGVTEDVDRVVLIGRAPAASASTARAPRLMTVPSPGQDISRTHVEVAPDGWQVVVTDLRSTNGTIVIQPGTGERAQLPPGEPVPVPLGSVLELGDGVSVLLDFPQ